MKRTMSLAALAVMLACGTASAQQINVKIGVLTDMSSLYADVGGPGSVVAAKLAIDDFTKANPNVKVEMVSADHQNKPDIGSQIANQWYDVQTGRHDRRRAEFRRRARRQPGHRAKEQGVPGLRRRRRPISPARSARQHHPLDL